MTSSSRAFQIKIVGDVADAKKSLQSLDGKIGKFGSSMAGVAKLMGAAFAAKQVFDFGKQAVERAEAMSSAYAAAAKIIDNTGGAANVTADGLKKMNRELAFQTGIDKQLISEASNVLLTFKGVANQVGEGNDVFNRANMLMLDMSSVFGGDVKGAATQLGKALENPIKGVGALAEVGVTFSDAEKEKIKVLQESGDILGAQQIVLAALEGQVGGVAAETADSSAIIGNAWKEVQEIVGNWLLPVLATLATFVTETLLPNFIAGMDWISEKWNMLTSLFSSGTDSNISKFTEWAKEIIEIVKGLVAMVSAIVERFVVVGMAIWEKYGDKISAVFSAVWGVVKIQIDLILGVLRGLIDFITAVFSGDWAGAWDAAKDIVLSFLEFFAKFPGKIVEYLRSAVGLVGSAALDLGKAIINGIIGFWNKLDPRVTMSVPSWLPGIGGKSWQSPDLMPDLPMFAEGGIATRPTAGIFGEAGAEALIPLDRAGGFGNKTYQIHVETLAGDPVAIGGAVVDAITEYERSSGTGWRDASGF